MSFMSGSNPVSKPIELVLSKSDVPVHSGELVWRGEGPHHHWSLRTNWPCFRTTGSAWLILLSFLLLWSHAVNGIRSNQAWKYIALNLPSRLSNARVLRAELEEHALLHPGNRSVLYWSQVQDLTFPYSTAIIVDHFTWLNHCDWNVHSFSEQLIGSESIKHEAKVISVRACSHYIIAIEVVSHLQVINHLFHVLYIQMLEI